MISFKYTKDSRLFLCLHPVLVYIFLTIVKPVLESEGIIEITITRTCDEMIDGISKTDIHSTGRALDIRTKNWFTDFSPENAEIKKKRIEKILNKELSERFGAVSRRTGKKVFAYYHIGTAEHLHLQIDDMPDDALVSI